MKLFQKMKVKNVYPCYFLILLVTVGILLIVILYGKQNSSKDGKKWKAVYRLQLFMCILRIRRCPFM